MSTYELPEKCKGCHWGYREAFQCNTCSRYDKLHPPFTTDSYYTIIDKFFDTKEYKEPWNIDDYLEN